MRTSRVNRSAARSTSDFVSIVGQTFVKSNMPLLTIGKHSWTRYSWATRRSHPMAALSLNRVVQELRITTSGPRRARAIWALLLRVTALTVLAICAKRLQRGRDPTEKT